MTSFRILMHSPGAHVFLGLIPGGLGHALQYTYAIYVCDTYDKNKYIGVKIFEEINISCAPQKDG